MFDPQHIKELISRKITCHFIDIQSEDGVHFYGIVVAEVFDGLPKVKQHQMVYATLGPLLGNEIHALQLNTLTPQQWQILQSNA